MREKMCTAVRLTLMAILDDELKAWVGADRYERSEGRLRVGVIIASERARGIWALASGRSKTCPFLGRAAGSRPSYLRNTSVGNASWTA
jgi:hypothetical protein